MLHSHHSAGTQGEPRVYTPWVVHDVPKYMYKYWSKLIKVAIYDANASKIPLLRDLPHTLGEKSLGHVTCILDSGSSLCTVGPNFSLGAIPRTTRFMSKSIPLQTSNGPLQTDMYQAYALSGEEDSYDLPFDIAVYTYKGLDPRERSQEFGFPVGKKGTHLGKKNRTALSLTPPNTKIPGEKMLANKILGATMCALMASGVSALCGAAVRAPPHGIPAISLRLRRAAPLMAAPTAGPDPFNEVPNLL